MKLGEGSLFKHSCECGKNGLEKKYPFCKINIFPYLSSLMIHGSAKICSDNAGMSLMGKPTSSLFVQIGVT